MPFTKITDADMNAKKGVLGLPDIPQLSKEKMQEKFEETGRELIIPAYNRLIDEMDSANGASNIRSQNGQTVEEHISKNVSSADVHGIQAYVTSYVNQRIQEVQAGNAFMQVSVYDRNNRGQDVYAYCDNAIKTAITSALSGDY